MLVTACATTDDTEVDPTEPTPSCVNVTAFVDQDRDGVGAGEPFQTCVPDPSQLPAGMAKVGGDCNDLAATRSSLLTAFVDFDGDHATSGPAVQLCVEAVPAGYRDVQGPEDCDDADARVFEQATFYVDADGDGYGAATGATELCAWRAPTGYAPDDSDPNDQNASITPLDTDGDAIANANDCAPTDASAWRMEALWIDADGDVRSPGRADPACVGDIAPEGFSFVSVGDDCDDTNAAIHSAKKLFLDADGDGAGAGEPVFMCVANVPAGYDDHGHDCDDANASIQNPRLWYRDADGDGYGAPNGATSLCAATPPAGFAARAFDNDDAAASITVREVRLAVNQGQVVVCDELCRTAVWGDLATEGDYINLTLSAHEWTAWSVTGGVHRVANLRILGYEGFELIDGGIAGERSTCVFRQGCGTGELAYDVFEQGIFRVE